MTDSDQTYVPHIGWLSHEHGDDVGRYLREGWFEYLERAFCYLFLRPGDVVIDCGAHVGLFSRLACRLLSGNVRVIALEPNPRTTPLLRANLTDETENGWEIVEAAASREAGRITLHAGEGSQSAYSSFAVDIEQSSDIEVPTVTLDSVIEERGIDRVDFLKIDVEGAELDVWAGCQASREAGRLPLIMVEFTEANQQDVGRSTIELARAWTDCGYTFHRFDAESMRLKPITVDEPIEYENLFAATDTTWVNERLAGASSEARRIAEDIVNSGAAAFGLLKRACDYDHFKARFDNAEAEQAKLLEDSNRHLAEANRLEHQMHVARSVLRQMDASRVMRAVWALGLSQRPDRLDELISGE